MPYCSILECKNDSRRKNIKNGGVSYHRFPKDATIKEKWIDATGRADWMPTKISTICSQHFVEDDFLISNKGYRYPKPTALPCFQIVKFVNEMRVDILFSSGQSQPTQRRLTMPQCALRYCKNNERKKKFLDGVSYFCFPSNPFTCQEWITIIARANGDHFFKPAKRSVICSDHFDQLDICGNSKRRRLVKTAVPKLQAQSDNDACSTSSLKRECVEYVKSCDSETQSIKKKRTQKETARDQSTGLNCSTLRKKKLVSQLRYCINKIKNKNLKIKRLQSENRRLKEKINSIDQVYKNLEEKFAVAMENLDRLENSNLEVQELVARKAAMNTASGEISSCK